MEGTAKGTGTTVETEDGVDKAISADIDLHTGKVTATPTGADGGLSQEVTGEAAPKAPAAAEGEKPTTETPPKETPTTPDLGEFTAAPEVVSKFDAQYFNAEGKLNKDTLTAEFWGNAKAAAEGVEATVGKLNDNTYAYLEHRLGVSKDFIEDIERGLIASGKEIGATHTAEVHALAGTAERYTAALAWAVKEVNGVAAYTQAQRDRFDDVVRNRKDGWEDAVTALMARFGAANPATTALPPGRPSSPARDATSGRPTPATVAATPPATPALVPFATLADYHDALREAGGDRRKNEEVRARLRASNLT